MGFFQNIKNKLGIGGAKVSLQVPAQVAKAEGNVKGKATITTKSEQEIITLKVKMVEQYSTGRGDEKTTKEYTLGQVTIPLNATIKPGETKDVEFNLPFTLLKSSNDELKEKGGALGALGKVSAFASAEKSEYFVEVDLDVKSAALDPSDRKAIKLI